MLLDMKVLPLSFQEQTFHIFTGTWLQNYCSLEGPGHSGPHGALPAFQNTLTHELEQALLLMDVAISCHSFSSLHHLQTRNIKYLVCSICPSYTTFLSKAKIVKTFALVGMLVESASYRTGCRQHNQSVRKLESIHL